MWWVTLVALTVAKPITLVHVKHRKFRGLAHLPDLSKVRQEFAHLSSGMRPEWQPGTLAAHLAQDYAADRAEESHQVDAPQSHRELVASARELIAPPTLLNGGQNDETAQVKAQVARDESIIEELRTDLSARKTHDAETAEDEEVVEAEQELSPGICWEEARMPVWEDDDADRAFRLLPRWQRSEEHTSELQSP